MTYAARTDVPADKSRADIEKVLKRYGADRFMWFTEPNRAVLIFEASKRRIRFDLPLPDKAKMDSKAQQLTRSRWRGLLLCITAKLESVESKIESFEDAFLAHVVMPDGKTVGEHSKPRIAQAYEGGEIQALLPGPEPKRLK